MDVLRMGGIRPSWASEARVELVPTPKSGWLAYRGGAHRVAIKALRSAYFTIR
jgi:hypothetical protein